MNKAKIILSIVGIIVAYVILIYCVRTFPVVRAIAKWISYSYVMVIIAIYLFGGVAMHFGKDKNNTFGAILWYMTWGILAIAPIGLAAAID